MIVELSQPPDIDRLLVVGDVTLVAHALLEVDERSIDGTVGHTGHESVALSLARILHRLFLHRDSGEGGKRGRGDFKSMQGKRAQIKKDM